MVKKARGIQKIEFERITIQWMCVNCTGLNTEESNFDSFKVRIYGGCGGYHYDGGYCYCGPPSAEVSTICGLCLSKTTLHLTS